MRTPITSALLLCALAGLAAGQSLTVNGHQEASVPTGRVMVVALAGTPGLPAFIGFNVDPGPTLFMGVSVPLGLGDGLAVATGQPIPADGMLELPGLAIPNATGLEGFVLYAAALVVDPTAPFGLAVSNQAQITFTRAPEAGEDNAGFVGDPLTLDGSATRGPGPLPAGFTFAWSVVQAPGGAVYALEGEATLNPTLIAETAGFYRLALDLIAPGSTGGARDTCEVHVFQLDGAGTDSGDFFAGGSVMMQAQIDGPGGATFALAGLDASTDGALAGSLPAGDPTVAFEFSATSLRGDVARQRTVLFANVGRPRGDVAPDAVALHLKEAGFDTLEALVNQAAANVDLATLLNGAIAGLPPIPVANVPAPFPPGSVLFSADVQPTAIAFDPGFSVSLTPIAGALRLEIGVTNLALVFDVTGLIFNAPYADVGTLTVPNAVVGVDLTTQVVGGAYQTVASNASLDLMNAMLTFQAGVIPASFSNGLIGVIEPALESAVGAILAPLLPPILDGALNALPTELAVGDVALTLTTSSVAYEATGVTLGFAVGADLVLPPTGPVVESVWTTPNPLPAFAALAPNGLVYSTGIAVSDDLVNQVFAEATRSGAVVSELSGTVDLGFGPLPLDAQSFALVFPDLGFDRLEPTTPLRVRAEAAVPPLFVPSLTGDARIWLGDVVVAIEAEIEPGYWGSMVRFGLTADAGAQPTLDPTTGLLSFVPGAITLQTTALTAIAGVDADPTFLALPFLFQAIVGGLLADLPEVALPTLPFGVTGTPVDLAIEGPGADYLDLYVD